MIDPKWWQPLPKYVSINGTLTLFTNLTNSLVVVTTIDLLHRSGIVGDEATLSTLIPPGSFHAATSTVVGLQEFPWRGQLVLAPADMIQFSGPAGNWDVSMSGFVVPYRVVL